MPLIRHSNAMARAMEVKAEYKELDRSFRKGLYKAIAGSLACYRIFLGDEAAQEALLNQDNIRPLREKPALDETSRLLLYYLTDARSEAERNIAGKYACIVDFLVEQGVENDNAAEYIQKANGIEELLKKARKGRALKAAEGTAKDDDQDLDQQEEPDEADDSASSGITNGLFDEGQDVSIRLGSKPLARVLSSAIPVNEVFYLECRKTGLGPNGIRIEGRLCDPQSE